MVYIYRMMKICLLLLSNLFLTFFCLAQIEQGKNGVGVSLGFRYSNDAKTSSRPKDLFLIVSPQVNYESFIYQNLSVLGGLGYSFSYRSVVATKINSQGQSYGTDYITFGNGLSLVLGSRKLWLNESGRIGFMLMPYTRIEYLKTRFTELSHNPQILPPSNYTESSTEKWKGFVNADLGFCYFIKPNLALEFYNTFFQIEINESYQRVSLFSNLSNTSLGLRFYY